jgi:HNH endonuclease
MSAFKNGVSENVHVKGLKLKHLRIKAGKQRDEYVHTLVFKVKILGRREAFDREHPGEPVPDNDFYSYLRDYETVDHDDQDSLNNDPGNLNRMTRRENTAKMMRHRADKKVI